MDSQKLLDTIGLYKQKFEALHVRKERYPLDKLLPFWGLRRRALSHCHNMLPHMEQFVQENRLEKTFRWLGFIQGVLWVLRLYTLDELKNHNCPAP